ncbi:MAG TPA: PilZ domain-containing protein [Blastocatellia bacterium]|nr:PilZ domain-containing protein [Blastocatellia bacterium]
MGYSAQDLSAYYYELDCLLARVEVAETHYKVLGIDYLATTDETITAYLKAKFLLDPATYGLDLKPAETFGPRVALALERVLAAYQTLMDLDLRLEYDGRLFGWGQADSGQGNSGQGDSGQGDSGQGESGQQATISYAERTNTEDEKANRRARERFELSIAVAVTGYSENAGDWREAGRSIDLSPSGGCILVRRRVLVGNILYLRMPMPTILRKHEFIEQIYATYAIVRWIRPPRDGFRLVGVEFIGELPPPGFSERPWATFHIGSWQGANRRAEPRNRVSEAIEIEYFDEAEQLIEKSSGFIEDISSSGVRVCAQAPPLEADLIRIIRPKASVALFAVVRNRFRGRDGYERLCAQFVGEGPDDDTQDH